MKRENLSWELQIIRGRIKESRRTQLKQEFEGCLEELQEKFDEGKFNKEQMDIITKVLNDGLMYGVLTVVENYDNLI